MPTKKSQNLALQIQDIFRNTLDGDGGLYEVATLIDRHVLLETARINQLEQAIGSMFDSQHDTPYGQE